ncbi:hypothetical protein EDB19DRAFT_1759122 [Suillus lakei]|nr:hypothetical protein EDB19DRAFT_1770231 [Suillus lakei]KAG1724616.1 hypothetical protein EDB19DRAFT_1759122 [Suillus lakei]
MSSSLFTATFVSVPSRLPTSRHSSLSFSLVVVWVFLLACTRSHSCSHLSVLVPARLRLPPKIVASPCLFVCLFLLVYYGLHWSEADVFDRHAR